MSTVSFACLTATAVLLGCFVLCGLRTRALVARSRDEGGPLPRGWAELTAWSGIATCFGVSYFLCSFPGLFELPTLVTMLVLLGVLGPVLVVLFLAHMHFTDGIPVYGEGAGFDAVDGGGGGDGGGGCGDG